MALETGMGTGDTTTQGMMCITMCIAMCVPCAIPSEIDLDSGRQ